MTLTYLALSIGANLLLLMLWLSARRKRAADKAAQQVAAAKADPRQRTIFCPVCSQQIRFNLPLSGNHAQCRKCTARFKLDVDANHNVYITEIKPPEPEQEPGINSIEACFAILDISDDALPMDIRAAYKKRISEYHPDKVELLGGKIKQLAEEETRLINQAYAMLEERNRV